ncbi:hypothetical protein QFC19_002651 [Naganishia cerealis]|uniref:Uncharacterized protein n=1 Tax=Naganishia cerealis TaxID=610337 RepID=A0ACC2W8Y8_9TREE|nr:hypothetical protein QFC19_002651 [Naganishia cerealis]
MSSFSQSFQRRDAAAQVNSEILERPAELISTKPSPNFKILCRLFESLRDKPQKRKEQITSMIQQWRDNVGLDLYPFFRLLLPERDRERATYGLKETALAKCYVEVLGLDPKSEAGHRLIHWKQPRPGDEATGDFPSVCYEAIKSRKSTTEKGGLTVDGVNILLDKLHTCRDRKDHIKIVNMMMHELSPEEQRWLIRIILKDLKAGVREKTVLSAFHPQAIELFNVSSDLKRVCWTLWDRHSRLNEKDSEVTIMRAFLPQLCKRLGSTDLNTVVKMMSNKPFLIEEKLDGERIQLHKKGDEYMYYSRKGHIYSYLYGEHVGTGTLTPYIHEAFGKNVRNCILDGEMLVWDPLLGKYLAFGSLKSAALDTSQQEDAPRPCFKVFDILMLNDTCLTSYTLRTRREVLYSKKGEHRVFEPVQGRLEMADLWEGRDASDIKDRLEWVMENRGEGLVVKNPLAPYELNGRSEQWVKVKPEYADELGENLDVFVLGGWWGSGKRGGKISSLLFGLRNEQEKEYEGQEPTFTTFGRVAGGLSFADHKWLQDQHGHHFKPFDRENPPSWIKFGPVGLDDKPDVYIEPDHSFVIEVKASEITPADGNFAAGLTVRFPRVKYIRHDRASKAGHATQEGDDENAEEEKIWDAWDSLSLQELIEFNNQRLERRYEPSQPRWRYCAKERSKHDSLVFQVATVSSSHAGQQVSSSVERDIFHGEMFYIARGTKAFDKKHLEQLVHKNGGDYCQKRTDNNEAIVISSIDTSCLSFSHGLEANATMFALVPDRWLLFANEETRSSKDYHVSWKTRDSPSEDEHDQMTVDEPMEEDTEKADDESDHSDRRRKHAYIPPEDIELGDKWTLRNVKTDIVPEEPDSEPESIPASLSVRVSPEYGSDAAEPTHSEETGDESLQSRFVADELPSIAFAKSIDASTQKVADGSITLRATPQYQDSSVRKNPSDIPVSPCRDEPTSKMGETNADSDYDEFRENGGKITENLYDPKLTHIICSSSARYKALVRETAE